MNTITHARVAAQDRLFETLDPTIRRLQLPNGDQAMVIDTVGFIHKIPHSLIEAFKSTLEEVRQADLLLHVIDLASPRCVEQIEVVDQVLRDIGAGETPRIRVLNKIDLAPPRPLPGAENGSSGPCAISALSGEGVEELLRRLAAILDQGKERMQISLTPAQASLLSLIRRRGRVVEERYEEGRIHVTAMLTPKLAGQLRKWLARAEDGPSPGPC
jgi:GTP-binding protein HflX